MLSIILLALYSTIDIIILMFSLLITDLKTKIYDFFLLNIIIIIFLTLSCLFRRFINTFININILKLITTSLLFYIGIRKLINYLNNKKELNNINIDKNNNKKLELNEIFIFAFTLAIDNMLICFSTDIIVNNYILFLSIYFIISNILIFICFNFISKFIKINSNIGELISSIIFFVLAISNII